MDNDEQDPRKPHLYLLICGGVNYWLSESDRALLDTYRQKNTILEVVHGGARGADTEGGRWAAAHGIPVKVFPADWTSHGKKAGPIRNAQMASYLSEQARSGNPVQVIAFPGGRGTADMVRKALAKGLPVTEIVAEE